MSQPSFDFGDPDGAVDESFEETYSVAELADALNRSLRRDFGDGVWVRGEIQGWSARGPHAYFSLADDSGGDQAVVNVQFFAPSRARLTPILKKSGLELRDGLSVRIFGHLDFYAPNGRIGLKMSGIDPRFTLGELAMSRAAVMQRLVESGAYDANRARTMPRVPLRLGVVASVGSAAWHDVHHLFEASELGFRLSVLDTRVQGDTAVRSVVASIRTLSARGGLDAVMVIRGGGARTDLATFDAEEVALAIAECPVPVLTGLGHEIDRSVADEVAFRAFTTPTACAAALVDAVSSYVAGTEAAWAGIERSAVDRLAAADQRLTDVAHRIVRRTHEAVDRADQRLDRRLERVGDRAPRVLEQQVGRLDVAVERLQRIPGRVLDAEDRHLSALAGQVGLLDPSVLLRRGWSITRTIDGRTVRDPADVVPGTVLETRVGGGSIRSVVTDPP